MFSSWCDRSLLAYELNLYNGKQSYLYVTQMSAYLVLIDWIFTPFIDTYFPTLKES